MHEVRERLTAVAQDCGMCMIAAGIGGGGGFLAGAVVVVATSIDPEFLGWHIIRFCAAAGAVFGIGCALYHEHVSDRPGLISESGKYVKKVMIPCAYIGALIGACTAVYKIISRGQHMEWGVVVDVSFVWLLLPLGVALGGITGGFLGAVAGVISLPIHFLLKHR